MRTVTARSSVVALRQDSMPVPSSSTAESGAEDNASGRPPATRARFTLTSGATWSIQLSTGAGHDSRLSA